MTSHDIVCLDGAKISATHWEAKGDEQRNCPVLLVHGFGNNASTWDHLGSDSIPHQLCESGYNVWAINLRQHQNLPDMSMVPYPKNQESGRGWNLTLVETRVLTYYIELIF